MFFIPGRVSTPEETSIAAETGNPHRFRQQRRIQAAREHPRPAPLRADKQAPVEGEAVAARHGVGPARRLGVEQQQIGDILVAGGHGDVLGTGERYRLDHLPTEPDPGFGHSLCAFAAVKLQQFERCSGESGLPPPDSWRSLRQTTYPQLLHHSVGHDRRLRPAR